MGGVHVYSKRTNTQALAITSSLLPSRSCTCTLLSLPPPPSLTPLPQARLVPMVCAALAPGARTRLSPAEAAGLLQSLAEPEAALNAGRLRQCFDALKVGGRVAPYRYSALG